MIFQEEKYTRYFFWKINKSDLLIVLVLVDDIKFGDKNEKVCEDFSNLMQSEYEMSMERIWDDGIFVCQEKYINDLFKKYKMNEVEIISTPMHHASSKLDKGKNEISIYEK